MKTIAYSSMDLVNQYQELNSGHFFDKNTMRFFNSRMTGNYKRVDDSTAYFITTERGPSGKRLATIRRAELVSYVRDDERVCFKIVIATKGEFNKLLLGMAKKEMGKL